MKNLIYAIANEQKNYLENFIKEINQLTDKKQLDHWQYNELLPRGKRTDAMSFEELKAYLVKRKEKAIYSRIEKQVDRINAVKHSGELIEAKISVEWKNNRTWGANPTAECWASFRNENGDRDSVYTKSGSIGGCGYDKLSTAVAQAVNQVNAILNPLYTKKDKQATDKNADVFGYGSGYGILPALEGGVGVSCYPRIFEAIGYEFKTIASGKTYDVFTITKKANN